MKSEKRKVCLYHFKKAFVGPISSSNQIYLIHLSKNPSIKYFLFWNRFNTKGKDRRQIHILCLTNRKIKKENKTIVFFYPLFKFTWNSSHSWKKKIFCFFWKNTIFFFQLILSSHFPLKIFRPFNINCFVLLKIK